MALNPQNPLPVDPKLTPPAQAAPEKMSGPVTGVPVSQPTPTPIPGSSGVPNAPPPPDFSPPTSSPPTVATDILAGINLPDLPTVPQISTPEAMDIAPSELRDVQEKDTVAGQLRDILSSSSPYLERARNEAMAFSASRGLQNSTLAAGAGEAAAIDRALPIASQDAATYFQQGMTNQQNTQAMRALAASGDVQAALSAQQGQINAQLQRQGHAERMLEMAQQGDVNAQLQLQQFGFNSELNAQQNLARLEELATNGDITAMLNLQQFNYQSLLADKAQGFQLQLDDQRFQQQQVLLDQEFRQALGLSREQQGNTIEQMNLAHSQTLDRIAAEASANMGIQDAAFTNQLQGAYLTSISNRQATASQEITAILQQEGLTTAQQQNAVSQAYTRMLDDFALLQAFYSGSPVWPNEFDFPNPYVAPLVTGPATGAPAPGGASYDLPRNDGLSGTITDVIEPFLGSTTTEGGVTTEIAPTRPWRPAPTKEVV